jgi:uncharacterized protein (TIGR02246 family)
VHADEEAVAAVVSARTEALVHGDVDRMRDILAPDFTYTDAGGNCCDREEYIAGYVSSPDLVWMEQALSDLRVRVYGEAAVVTVDAHDRAVWRGGLFEADVRSLFVYVRRDGTWRCVAGQTTARPSGTG